MRSLQDFIIVYENIVPLDLCDEIISEYGSSTEWVKTALQDGNVYSNLRNCTSVNVSLPEVVGRNAEVRKKLDRKLFDCASNAIKLYSTKYQFCNIEQDYGYELLKYEVGQFFVEHTDSFKAIPRAVSCSFALNDDYKGGEFAFFNGSVTTKIPKGAALLFPSNFMYPHQIMPVTEGTRYSIITWFI